MFVRLMGVIGGVVLSAGEVLAQSEQKASPLKSKEEPTLVAWVIGAVFLVATLVVAFKPAKRSNLR